MRLSRLCTVLAFVGMLLVVGCEVTETLTATDSVDFGDMYAIATSINHIPSATPPRLDVNALHVTVQYGGGCARHRFDLQFRTRGDTTEVWLQHDGNGDACEAYLTETLTVTVPSRVLDTANVVLLAPDGTTFKLR